MRTPLVLVVLVGLAGSARADDEKVDPKTGLTPCDAACLQMFLCLPQQRHPTYSDCVRTCDARRTTELAALATASCSDIDAALASGTAPIRRRDCTEILATRKKARRPAAGRRELLASKPWCVSGTGALAAGPNGFAVDGLLLSGGTGACWTLEGDRLVWTYDGGKWRSAVVRWPRRDADPIRVGAQRLAICPDVGHKDPHPILP